MIIVIGGKPSEKSRKARLNSTDINRHHASPWHTFDTLRAANEYADALLQRHPGWIVAVIDTGDIISHINE